MHFLVPVVYRMGQLSKNSGTSSAIMDPASVLLLMFPLQMCVLRAPCSDELLSAGV